MTLHLTTEQSHRWLEGSWSAFELEETILEDLERQRIHEPVVIMLASGGVAFGITTPGERMA